MRVTTTMIALTILSLIAVPTVARVHDARALAADPTEAKEPIAPKLKGLSRAADRPFQS